nr:hypothetical protein K4M19_00464 [Agrobacterium fabrum]
MECILIGAPLQIGAGHLGCEMGPSALRIAGLPAALEELGHRVRDVGNLGPKSVQAIAHPNASVHHLSETVAWIKLLSAAAYEHSNNSVPIFLGGDHTISAGTVPGIARRASENGRPLLFSGLMPTPISIRWKPPSAKTCMVRLWPTILAGVVSRVSFQR